MRIEKHKYIILPNTNNTKSFCGRRPTDSRAAHAHMQDDSNSPPQEPHGGNLVLDRKSGETGAHPDNAKRYTPESVETETMVFYDHDKLE